MSSNRYISGLSPDLISLADVEKIPRPAKAVDSGWLSLICADNFSLGLLCDLLWSDPDEETLRFAPNSERGLSYVFGAAAVNEFLETNDLDLIVRAHQVSILNLHFFLEETFVSLHSRFKTLKWLFFYLNIYQWAFQVVEDGYEFFNKMRLVTIFSVPNYCGEKGNHGAVLKVSEDLECSFTVSFPI